MLVLLLGLVLFGLSWYIPHLLQLWFLLSLLLLLIGMLLLFPVKKEQVTHTDADTWRARLEAAINSMYMGFMLIDANHNLITINARAQTLLHVMPPLSGDFFYKNLPIITKDFTIQRLEEKLAETVELKSMIDTCILQKSQWKHLM